MKASVCVATALLIAAAISGPAQPATAFEVASVKVSPPRVGKAGYTSLDADAAMVRYTNVTLEMLVAIAYRFDSNRILSGPAWLTTESYDLAAKLPPDASKDRVPEMLQTLLAERFKLAVHRQSREQRVYFLVAAKNGTRLKRAQEDGGQSQMMRGDIRGPAMSMSALAGMLSRFAGLEVVDKTGLSGTFSIHLRWTPEDQNGFGPELFAALEQQLGLKLEAGRAPVESLIVDHAERVPAEN